VEIVTLKRNGGIPLKNDEKANARDSRVSGDADTAHATPLSVIVLALCFLSFGIFLVSSDAVRFVLAETARLVSKFSS
jgi:hypothetical protein